MATYSATGLAIFDSSLDPPLDNRPKLSSIQSESVSVCGQPPTPCAKCGPPDFAAPSIRPVASSTQNTPSPNTRDLLNDRSAYPTPSTTQGELQFFTPTEVYRTPYDVLGSCATTSLYLSPMVNLQTPTSTYDGVFATPETTPAISYYESTKNTPNIHQTPHTANQPWTVESSGFSPPFEQVSNGAIDYRPKTVMTHVTPTSSIDMECHSSLHTSSDAPLEQDFRTPDGSPLSPYQTPHNGSPELLLEFQPSVGYRASPTFGHPLNFLSFSSPSSLGTSQGTPTKHRAATSGSAHPTTISNKGERLPTLEGFQTTQRLRTQGFHTPSLRRSRSSISLTSAGSTTEGSHFRAREMTELAQELQKAREITEDFVHSSPEEFGPPQNSRLAEGNALGSPPNKYESHARTFNPCHARFLSTSTASTAFFDVEEKDDAGIPDEMNPGRKSLRIVTVWPTRAATPPPLLSPFKEKSNGAAPGDDPLMTPNVTQENPMVPSTPPTDSPVVPADAGHALLKRTKSQSDISSTVGTPSRSPSSPSVEGLRVQDAPTIVVEHPDLGRKTPMEISELLTGELSAGEHEVYGRVNDSQVQRRFTTHHGFAQSTSTALGLSPSIYLSPMHEAQFSNNSLDLTTVIKPEIERGLSTPSFISGVLQAGLLLERLERENTTSFEEDTEAVHFQVLSAVVGTRKQMSSSGSLSHYSTEESPEHSQLHLSNLGSTNTIYVTATDLSTAAQPSSLHNPDLQPPSNHPPHLTLPPASKSAVGPLPRPSSIMVSDSADFVHSLSKSSKVDQGAQLLNPTVDTTGPILTGVEDRPSNGSRSASDSKPLKVSADPSNFSGEPDAEVEEGPNRGAQAVTPSRVRRAATRSTSQPSEDHLSSAQYTSTLRPLSASGSVSVSPVSPSSVISRASARLTNPFAFLHPSPLSSTSPYSSDVSPVGPRRLLKTPEQPRSHKRSETFTPGDMKRPSPARQRLSKFLGGVDFGVGKASSPMYLRDKADTEPTGPDVFGAGEGRESWIRDSRESATNHRGLPSLDNNADREAAKAVQEGKTKKRRISVRPASMIWLGSNKEKSPVAARDGKKSTKFPLGLHPSTQPRSNDPNSWSMLDSSALSAVRNNEGLRIINLPPPPAVGATVDVPRSHESRLRRKSVVVSSNGEESETELGQMKRRSRGSFLGSFIRK